MMIWLKEKLRQRNLDRPLRILPLMTLPMYVPVRVLITADHLEYTPIVPAYICTHNVNIRKTLLNDPAYVSSHGDPNNSRPHGICSLLSLSIYALTSYKGTNYNVHPAIGIDPVNHVHVCN